MKKDRGVIMGYVYDNDGIHVGAISILLHVRRDRLLINLVIDISSIVMRLGSLNVLLFWLSLQSFTPVVIPMQFID